MNRLVAQLTARDGNVFQRGNGGTTCGQLDQFHVTDLVGIDRAFQFCVVAVKTAVEVNHGADAATVDITRHLCSTVEVQVNRFLTQHRGTHVGRTTKVRRVGIGRGSDKDGVDAVWVERLIDVVGCAGPVLDGYLLSPRPVDVVDETEVDAGVIGEVGGVH